MNRSALKKYAPQARLDFIEAVTQRARRLGLDPTLPASVEQTGDVLLIAGQPFPASVAKQRTALAQRVQQQGFNAVVEALAYTWFNRLVAIRFMELKGYLSHGYRVLSHPQGQQPEILDHVQHLDLPGLDKVEVIRLKTAGNQDEALYREILLAQCHELHRNMPFLFEALDDATELLLPDNLLRTDSPIAHLVSDIEEGDWQEVEVIGWLYQFYISDKKDEVIGKVVKSEDIPAATQLFTPNWIVQYLVQNSLGRLWLMANPGSTLREKGAMKYYIEPAEQTPEVQAQLNALIKVRMDEDGGTLNPESLTVLDPACGSGHILVEAYNLLRAIYEERGYPLREIPRLILQKNLYGLDIDDRAAQLAGFALLMKAREDDRRLFDEEGNPPHLNVMAIQQSAGLPDEEIARVILNAAIQIEGGDAFHSGQLFGGGQLETQHSSGLTALDLRQLIKLFEHGKTFGSLISVPDALKVKLGKIFELLTTVRSKGDDLSRNYACQVLEHFAWPASVLALKFDVVIANPPYMGLKYFNEPLKKFVHKNYQEGKGDLYTAFVMRCCSLVKGTGLYGMITIPNWMFLSSYEDLRNLLISESSIEVLCHNGRGVFGSDFGSCSFVARGTPSSSYVGKYKRLFSKQGEVSSNEELNEKYHVAPDYKASVSDFSMIPGSPFAYWVSNEMRKAFSENLKVSEVASTRKGMVTANNDIFVRAWQEIDISKANFNSINRVSAEDSGGKWFPYIMGGEFRKWYGNREFVVNWLSDGSEIRNKMHPTESRVWATNFNLEYIFKPNINWNSITASRLAFRFSPGGELFASTGLACFLGEENFYQLLAFLNSKACEAMLAVVAPTLSANPGDIGRLPFYCHDDVGALAKAAVGIAKVDWDLFEQSWDFSVSPIVSAGGKSISDGWEIYSQQSRMRLERLYDIEVELNESVIGGLGLSNDNISSVSYEEITTSRADPVDDSKRLVSYMVGCMMGRYSFDEPGLIYAHSGGLGFDSSRYSKFSALNS